MRVENGDKHVQDARWGEAERTEERGESGESGRERGSEQGTWGSEWGSERRRVAGKGTCGVIRKLGNSMGEVM
jgi:hypothetical protein